jgi:hypothetical protein
MVFRPSFPDLEPSDMSLEAAIEKLTEALTANTALLQTLVDRGALNSAAKPAATVAPVEETVNSSVEAPPAAEKRKPGRPPKAKPITEADLRSAFGSYMANDDEDEKDRRKAKVKKMLKFMGAEKVTEVPEERRQEVLDHLAVLVAGGTPSYEVEQEDEDEEALI